MKKETELTSVQKARRKYEETHKAERALSSGQFSTFIPRKDLEEINDFLEKNRLTKVALIMTGFEALKDTIEKQNKM